MIENKLDKQQLQIANSINNSSNLLVGLVNDILDFSKIESGMLELENEPFELNKILDYIADIMSLKVKNKSLDLVFDVDHNMKHALIF